MFKINLENVKAELSAIPGKEVKTPSIPVFVYIQEAEDQKVWAEDDKGVLINHGPDWTFVESLPVRASVCREAQSVWSKEFKSREDAEKEWLEKFPDACKLRDCG